MNRLFLAVTAVAVLAGPAAAYDFPFGLFKRKSRSEAAATPARAKQYATTLTSNPDEAARRQAAEELRAIDPRSNPEVFPALIGALQKDPSPTVRVAAAESVGKLKPVYQPAGIVLEQVAKSDPDSHVRDAAEAALLQYHLGGYRTPAKPKGTASAEPPVARGRPAGLGVLTFRPITTTPPGRGVFYPPTAEPPLAKKPTAAPAKPASTPAAGVPRPMPSVMPLPAPSTPTLPPPVAVPSIPAPNIPTGPLPPITVPPPG